MTPAPSGDAATEATTAPSAADVRDVGATVTPGSTEPGWTEAAVQASAWLLVVLLPVHVVATVVLDDPATTTSADVLARWEQPAWRVLDWLVVVLGLGHAALGVWRAAHRGRPSARRTVVAAVVVLACGLLAAGATVAIATTGV